MSFRTLNIKRLLSKLLLALSPQNWNPTANRSRLKRYGVALLSVAMAALLKLGIDFFIEIESPFLLFFTAVMFSGWYGGMGPGALATVLAAIVVNYFFLSPSGAILNNSPDQNLQFILFSIEGLLISGAMAAMQSAKQERQAIAEQAKTHLQSFLEIEERYRSLVEDVKDYAIYMLDPQGRVTNWNAGAERIKGYRAREIIGQHFSIFYTDEDKALGIPELLLQRAITEGRVESEGWRLRKDGSRFWANVVITSLRDADGNLKGFVKITSDATESQQTQEELQISVKQLSDINSALDEAAIVVRTDANGVITYVNDKFCEISKYSREELIGKTHRIINSGYHTKEFFGKLWRTISRGEIWKGEIKNKAKDGTYYWVDTTIVPFLDESGKPFQYLAIRYDVTARKLTEEALRQSEARSRRLIDSDLIGILVADFSGNISEANDAFLAMVGYTQSDLAAGRMRWIEITPPEYWSLDERAIEQVKITGACTPYEKEYIRSDGSRVAILIGISRIQTDKDDCICFVLDMSERQRAEQERIQLLQREQAARAKAEANEQYYRFLAENIPQIVWTARPDGWLDYYNQRWFDYTGMTLEQTQGWGWQTVLHPDDLQPCLDAWERSVRTGETYQIEYRLKRASDGTYRWHLGRALPLRDKEGRIVKWFGTGTDIDEQKRTQEERAHLLAREQAARTLAEAAAERVERLQAVTDAAIAPLSLDDLLEGLLDRISQILRADTAAVLLLDPESNSLIVKAARGLDKELERQICIPVGQGFFGRIAAERQPLFVFEDAYTQVYSPILQQQKIQSLLGVPLLIEDRVLGVFHVGTLQRRQFTRDDIYLLQLVADRFALAIDRANLYEAEMKARTQAEAASRIKDEFLAIVSHELRTPLNSILGWAQTLRSRKMSEAITTKALETIERNAKQQVKLIDDILDVSRIIRGKVRLTLVPVSLGRIISEAIETVSSAAEAKNIQIIPSLPQTPVQMMGDPDRLQQIVWNLLTNAIKFTPEGGLVEVQLSEVMELGGKSSELESYSIQNSDASHQNLDASHQNLDASHQNSDASHQNSDASHQNSDAINRVSTSQNYSIQNSKLKTQNSSMSYAQITVKDTGIGIKTDFLPYVFEGFRQADASITRTHGGLGLGLTIVRYLAELHGGTVRAFSEGEGKGSTFTVKMPLKASNIGEEQPVANTQCLLPVSPLVGLRILVVDDDTDTCDLIATVLSQYGGNVTTASSAREALEILERSHLDVLVSDIGMPEENGYQLIRRIRKLEQERGGKIPAIALTAYAREEDRRQAMLAGFQSHVAKPVEPAKLATAVASLATQPC